MTIEFKPWGKTPRLFREIVITEKIDGTNGCVVVTEPLLGHWVVGTRLGQGVVVNLGGKSHLVAAQSRNRIVIPENDNAGFARWVFDNAEALAAVLGLGYHYGEWWGQGIQRGYGLDHKRFSLFNTSRWTVENTGDVPGLDVVPELYRGTFDEDTIYDALWFLRHEGSVAAAQNLRPGQKAEGIIVYHSQSKQVYKVLLENDHQSKTEAKA